MVLKTLVVFKERPEDASDVTMASTEVICVEENKVAQKGFLDL